MLRDFLVALAGSVLGWMLGLAFGVGTGTDDARSQIMRFNGCEQVSPEVWTCGDRLLLFHDGKLSEVER